MRELYLSFVDEAPDQCLHYTIVVVDERIEIVQKLDCQSRECFDRALTRLDQIALRLPATRAERYVMCLFKVTQNQGLVVSSPDAPEYICLLYTSPSPRD